MRIFASVLLIVAVVLAALPAAAAPPPAVSALTALAGHEHIVLSWESTGAGDTYRVVRDGTEVAVVDALTFTDDVAAGVVHDYVIEAVAPDGVATPVGSVTGNGLDLQVDDPVGLLQVVPLDAGGVRVVVATRYRVTEATHVEVRVDGVPMARQALDAWGTGYVDLPELVADAGAYVDAVLYDAVGNAVLMVTEADTPAVSLLVDPPAVPAPPVAISGSVCLGRAQLVWETFDGGADGQSGAGGDVGLAAPSTYDVFVDGDLVDTVEEPRWSGMVTRGSTVAVRSALQDRSLPVPRVVTHLVPVEVPDRFSLACQDLSPSVEGVTVPNLRLAADPDRVNVAVGDAVGVWANPHPTVLGAWVTGPDGDRRFVVRRTHLMELMVRPGSSVAFVGADGQVLGERSGADLPSGSSVSLTPVARPGVPGLAAGDGSVVVDLAGAVPTGAESVEVRVNGVADQVVPAGTSTVSVPVAPGRMVAVQLVGIAADGSRSPVSAPATTVGPA